MGKSHRKVFAMSCSVSYHSPHDRGFAKRKKADSHRQIRTHNRNCDDDTIEYFNCKIGKMNRQWPSGYRGPNGNIPNMEYYDIHNFKSWSKHKWNNDSTNLLETIDMFEKLVSNEHGVDYDSHYLQACKKQIERRGNVGRFYGHRCNKHYDLYT